MRDRVITYEDFRDRLREILDEAEEGGERTLTVTSKELVDHFRSPNAASASGVMWLEAGKGDFIVLEASRSGMSSKLVITYGLPRARDYPFPIV